MTQHDIYFSLQVEELLSKVADPAYRQIVVEVPSTLLADALH